MRVHSMDGQVGGGDSLFRQGNLHGMVQSLAAVRGGAKGTQLYSERVPFLVLPLRAREDSMESVLHLRLAFGKCPQTILVEKLEQYPLAWEQSGRPWQQCGDRMDLTFCEEWKQP